jgi:hypothetical protein
MRIVTVGVTDSTTWAVRQSDPAVVPLRDPAGWSVVNPLVPLRQPFAEPYATCCYFWDGDSWYLTSHALHFVVPEGATSDEVDSVTLSILKRLRYVSKQAELPADHALQFPWEIEALPATVFPPTTITACKVRDSFVDTPITMDAVREAGELPLDFNPPVYDTLLLDAMKLSLQSDYRGAILYAAIAVESMATSVIGEEYERLLQASPVPDYVRVIEVAIGGGQRQRLDPIYRSLTTRGRFELLMHEVPLYVLRRSLRIENEPLSQRAVALYRTRNELAHAGEAEFGDQTLPITRAGSIAALSCAVEVFGWFGVRGNYAVPRGEWRDLQRESQGCPSAF